MNAIVLLGVFLISYGIRSSPVQKTGGYPVYGEDLFKEI
jgi:hypothetical protein